MDSSQDKKTLPTLESKAAEPENTHDFDRLIPAGLKLGGMIDALPHGLTVVDRRYTVLFQNRAAKNLDGERIGQRCFRANGARIPRETCPLARSLRDGRLRRTERAAYVDPERTLSVTATPVRDETGAVVGAVEISNDITEERNRSKRLIDQMRQLRKSLLISRRITPTSGLKQLNKKILRITRDFLELDCAALVTLEGNGNGPVLQDAVGYPEIASEKLRSLAAEGLAPWVMAAGKADHFSDWEKETRFPVSALVSEAGIRSAIAAPLLIGREAFGVLIGHAKEHRRFLKQDLDICQNIANQAAVAIQYSFQLEALQASEARYRDLYDNLPDMYHSLDGNGIILDCNETEARMLGFPKEEIVGRPFSDFLTENSKQRFDEQFNHLSPDHPQFRLEREFCRKDGTSFLANLHVFAEFGEDGLLRKTRTLTRDISERRALETELLKVQKLESLGTLAGGLAHDFNNLLTAILGNINMARIETAADDRVVSKLIEAEKGTIRAREITQQLLTFSKGGAPVRKPAPIADLIRDSADFALRGSNVKCQFTLPDDLLAAEIDEGQISQVIHNLIINADHAMPEGGAIEVTAANRYVTADLGLPIGEGRYVVITVRDQGIGIHPTYLHKVFDPFFTTKQKGSGLGLATVYSIVSKHDGYITVESRPAEGTAFHLYLPATDKPVTKLVSPSAETVHVGHGRILLMDDDEMVRDIAGDILSYFGYDVEYAGDGEEALNLFQHARRQGEPFDVLIMDLTIPGGMGGKETMEQLRRIDPEVRAIVSSGYSNDPVMANYEKYGFRGVVTKPYNVEELGRALQDIVGGPA